MYVVDARLFLLGGGYVDGLSSRSKGDAYLTLSDRFEVVEVREMADEFALFAGNHRRSLCKKFDVITVRCDSEMAFMSFVVVVMVVFCVLAACRNHSADGYER